MKFTKMQGSGNDFILIETDNIENNWSSLAISLCDRHYGIGADGLLLLVPSTKADCRMRIFNADGSEASACGNGLRCLVRYFVDGRLNNSGAKEITVETAAGVRRAEVYKTPDKETRVKTGMGNPAFNTSEIPVTISPDDGDIVYINKMMLYPLNISGRKLPVNLISVGNAHAVYFYHKPVTEFQLDHLGPKIERHQIFPAGVNFEVVRVVNRGYIEARVWEHGVGETLACGSGACAIMVAARLHGYVDDKVSVQLPGGILEIDWDGKTEVFLSGPAETVFTGEWPG